MAGTQTTEEPVDAEVVAEEDVGPTDEQLEREIAEQAADVEQERGREVAVREKVTVDPATMPTPREWEAMRAMAETVCNTDFVPRDFRGRPEAVLAAILAGRELGIGPMQSLKDISIIDGRPALAAHLVLALLRKGGVTILDSESTAERAWIRAQRAGGEVCEVEWTIEEAKTAGLAIPGKKNWEKYPADMLWARAVGRLGRRLGSDLLAGMPYTAEETDDFEDNDLDDGPAGYSSRPMESRRVDGPPPVELPKSWGELDQKVAVAFGAVVVEDFHAFVQQAATHLYGKEQSTDLTKAEKDVVWQKSVGAYAALVTAVQRELPPPTRAEMQAAWASVLDGAVLDGPAYSLGPDEPDRPARDAQADADAPAPGSVEAKIEEEF